MLIYEGDGKNSKTFLCWENEEIYELKQKRQKKETVKK